MRHLSPEDQQGDTLTAHNPQPFPVPVPEVNPGAALVAGSVPASTEPRKPPKWHRDEAPTDGKEAFKYLRAIEDGHAVGEVFYHPGRGLNVVKAADGTITPVSSEPGDEEAWRAAGSYGPAPLLKDRPKELPAKAEHRKKGD